MHERRLLTCGFWWGLALLVGTVGCSKSAPQSHRERPKAIAVDDAPRIAVTEAASGYVYRYFPEGSRKAALATKIGEIPQAVRDLVIVIPDDVEVPAGLAYVADLSQPPKDGAYPYRVVPTADLDRVLDEKRGEAPEPPSAPLPPAAPKPGKDEIIMFSASWCGVCAQAKRWFRNKGIAFTEKDVDQPGVREELKSRAKQAGLPASKLNGVPIIWVNGHMLPGFDPHAIQNLLKG